MQKKQLVNNVIVKSNGIAKTADLLSAGLSKSDITNLVSCGYIERIHHGYYKLADSDEVSDEQLISTLLPEGIVCMESALFYYGYSDFAPRIWSIAVPRGITKTKVNIDIISFKPYYIQDNLHEIGKTYGDFNGISLPVYDRERTICDCFKYRTRLDRETFNKAVNAYVRQENKNLTRLSMYAKELKVHKKVMELMEVLLDG